MEEMKWKQRSKDVEAQYDEIISYLRIHDPEAEHEVFTAPSKGMGVVGYLYNHGIPVVMVTVVQGENLYSTGSYDASTGNVQVDEDFLTHSTLMNLIREQIA